MAYGLQLLPAGKKITKLLSVDTTPSMARGKEDRVAIDDEERRQKNWRCQAVVHSFLPANVVEWHKYTLVPQFRTLLIALLIVLELLNLCNFIPAKISIASLTLHIPFTSVVGFGFMPFDLQLTIHLLIFFNFTVDFVKLTW